MGWFLGNCNTVWMHRTDRICGEVSHVHFIISSSVFITVMFIVFFFSLCCNCGSSVCDESWTAGRRSPLSQNHVAVDGHSANPSSFQTPSGAHGQILDSLKTHIISSLWDALSDETTGLSRSWALFLLQSEENVLRINESYLMGSRHIFSRGRGYQDVPVSIRLQSAQSCEVAEAVPQFPHNSSLCTSQVNTDPLVTPGKNGWECEVGTGLV
jgi:hypothetical protein